AVEAIRSLGLVGLAVTMPHKEDAARACDDLTDDARRLGAVNSVRHSEDDRLVGDSTDGEGFVRALLDAGHEPARRRVLALAARGAPAGRGSWPRFVARRWQLPLDVAAPVVDALPVRTRGYWACCKELSTRWPFPRCSGCSRNPERRVRCGSGRARRRVGSI